MDKSEKFWKIPVMGTQLGRRHHCGHMHTYCIHTICMYETYLKFYKESGPGAIDVEGQHITSKKIRASLAAVDEI